LELQKINGVALLGEEANEHIGARELVATARLGVNGGTLEGALKPVRGLRSGEPVGGETRQDLVEIMAQLVKDHAASAQHGDGVTVVGQRQKQVLGSRVLVTALAG
jgi:hypothetical protein